MPEAANLLRRETSPYLLQHADNPVHWRPWGAAALAEAAAGRQADPALHRLRRLPLVPRHGARILRRHRHGRADEQPVRQHQGGPRGTARHRPPLHVRPARHGRAGRLAPHHVPCPGRHALLGRHLFPARAALGPPLLPPGAARRRRRLAGAGRDGHPQHRRPAPRHRAPLRPAARRPPRPHASGRGRPGACSASPIPTRAASVAPPNSPTRRSSASSGRTPSAPASRRARTRCT